MPTLPSNLSLAIRALHPARSASSIDRRLQSLSGNSSITPRAPSQHVRADPSNLSLAIRALHPPPAVSQSWTSPPPISLWQFEHYTQYPTRRSDAGSTHLQSLSGNSSITPSTSHRASALTCRLLQSLSGNSSITPSTATGLDVAHRSLQSLSGNSSITPQLLRDARCSGIRSSNLSLAIRALHRATSTRDVGVADHSSNLSLAIRALHPARRAPLGMMQQAPPISLWQFEHYTRAPGAGLARCVHCPPISLWQFEHYTSHLREYLRTARHPSNLSLAIRALHRPTPYSAPLLAFPRSLRALPFPGPCAFASC